MDTTSSLYSIGHGRKTQEQFLAELKLFDIHYLIDVRTSPYSKWSSHFDHGVIEGWLAQGGIKYAYWGDTIGGRPANDQCCDSEGYFDYQKMAEEPEFRKGLDRLVKAASQGYRVAIMCSESDPTQCHRSKLIGRELYFSHDISVNHIYTDKKETKDRGKTLIKSQASVMEELTNKGWSPEMSLFGTGEPPYFRSCKRYKSEQEELDSPYD